MRHLARLLVGSEAWPEALTREADAVRVAATQTNVAAKTTLAVAATLQAEAEQKAMTILQTVSAKTTTTTEKKHGIA